MRRRVLPGAIGAGLLGGLLWWLTGSQPPPPAPQPPPNPAPTPAPTNTISQLLDAHNRYRAQHNVPALALNAKLTAAAQKHARWMANNRRMSHTGVGGSSFADRIRAEGYDFRMGGENIAAGYKSVDAAMTGWMNSPGHRANILNPNYKEVGLGVVNNYWCTVFATPFTSTNAVTNSIIELPGGIRAGDLDEFGP